MEIRKEQLDNQVILYVEGRLDTSSAPRLEEEMKQVSLENKLIFDFGGLDYISSAGLRVLLVTKKMFKDQFILRNVKEEVKQILEITGFIDMLTIE